MLVIALLTSAVQAAKLAQYGQTGYEDSNYYYAAPDCQQQYYETPPVTYEYYPEVVDTYQ